MRRERHEYGNDEFAAFAGRMLAAFARRIGTGDVAGLADLAEHARRAEEAVGTSARALVTDCGYSWADVGRALGVTRQAAFQRYGKETR